MVHRDGVADLKSFLQSRSYRTLEAEHSVIGTSVLSREEIDLRNQHDPTIARLLSDRKVQVVLRHRKIWFPSYPCEWPPELLYEAAELTLRTATLCLQEGFGLKDATPFNVLFEGGQPACTSCANKPSFESRQTSADFSFPG
ncbi:MAG: hypothetical protein AB1898_24085 [Acidobacteriota bacterium]